MNTLHQAYNFTSCKPDEAHALITRFHYSRRMPANIQAAYCFRKNGGLFGDFGEIEDVCTFSIPPTRWSEDVFELSRLVAHPNFSGNLSQLIGKSCKRLRGKIDLLVSFADLTQKHHGGIYQACSWHCADIRKPRMEGVLIEGVFWPGRSCNSKFGTQSPEKLRKITGKTVEPKFDHGKVLYWRALNSQGQRKAQRLGLGKIAYPKPDTLPDPDHPLYQTAHMRGER